MSKKKVQPVAEESIQEPGTGTPAPEYVPPVDEKPKKAKKASFDVVNASGSFVRTYSVEVHGEDAEDKAEQFAKKIGGSVR